MIDFRQVATEVRLLSSVGQMNKPMTNKNDRGKEIQISPVDNEANSSLFLCFNGQIWIIRTWLSCFSCTK